MSEVQTELGTQQERKITLYATRGGKGKNILSSASTKGELNQILKTEGYEPSKFHFTENIHRTDLVNDHAKLPTGDFTLFIRPKDSKAGASKNTSNAPSYSEMKAQISSDSDLKDYMSQEAKKLGKNWTQLKSDEMSNFISKYNKKGGSKASSSKAEKKAPAKSTSKTSTKKEVVKKEAPKSSKTTKKETPKKTDNGVGKVVKDVASSKGSVTSTNEDVSNAVENLLMVMKNNPNISPKTITDTSVCLDNILNNDNSFKEDLSESERLKLEKEARELGL